MLFWFWMDICESFYLKEVFLEFWFLYMMKFLFVVIYYWCKRVLVLWVFWIFWRYLFMSLLVGFVEFLWVFVVDVGVFFFCDNVLFWVLWCSIFFFVNVGEVSWLMYFGLLLLFEFCFLIFEFSIWSYWLWLNLLYVLNISVLL